MSHKYSEYLDSSSDSTDFINITTVNTDINTNNDINNTNNNINNTNNNINNTNNNIEEQQKNLKDKKVKEEIEELYKSKYYVEKRKNKSLLIEKDNVRYVLGLGDTNIFYSLSSNTISNSYTNINNSYNNYNNQYEYINMTNKDINGKILNDRLCIKYLYNTIFNSDYNFLDSIIQSIKTIISCNINTCSNIKTINNTNNTISNNNINNTNNNNNTNTNINNIKYINLEELEENLKLYQSIISTNSFDFNYKDNIQQYTDVNIEQYINIIVIEYMMEDRKCKIVDEMVRVVVEGIIEIFELRDNVNVFISDINTNININNNTDNITNSQSDSNTNCDNNNDNIVIIKYDYKTVKEKLKLITNLFKNNLIAHTNILDLIVNNTNIKYILKLIDVYKQNKDLIPTIINYFERFVGKLNNSNYMIELFNINNNIINTDINTNTINNNNNINKYKYNKCKRKNIEDLYNCMKKYKLINSNNNKHINNKYNSKYKYKYSILNIYETILDDIKLDNKKYKNYRSRYNIIGINNNKLIYLESYLNNFILNYSKLIHNNININNSMIIFLKTLKCKIVDLIVNKSTILTTNNLNTFCEYNERFDNVGIIFENTIIVEGSSMEFLRILNVYSHNIIINNNNSIIYSNTNNSININKKLFSILTKFNNTISNTVSNTISNINSNTISNSNTDNINALNTNNISNTISNTINNTNNINNNISNSNKNNIYKNMKEDFIKAEKNNNINNINNIKISDNITIKRNNYIKYLYNLYNYYNYLRCVSFNIFDININLKYYFYKLEKYFFKRQLKNYKVNSNKKYNTKELLIDCFLLIIFVVSLMFICVKVNFVDNILDLAICQQYKRFIKNPLKYLKNADSLEFYSLINYYSNTISINTDNNIDTDNNNIDIDNINIKGEKKLNAFLMKYSFLLDINGYRCLLMLLLCFVRSFLFSLISVCDFYTLMKYFCVSLGILIFFVFYNIIILINTVTNMNKYISKFNKFKDIIKVVNYELIFLIIVVEIIVLMVNKTVFGVVDWVYKDSNNINNTNSNSNNINNNKNISRGYKYIILFIVYTALYIIFRNYMKEIFSYYVECRQGKMFQNVRFK